MMPQPQLTENLNGPDEFGAVKGRLERLNLHDHNEFTLYPPIPGYSITCEFPEELFDKVHLAIRRSVTVYGKLTFKQKGPYPERVVVHSLEIHPVDSELPSLQSLRGLLLDPTNGVKTADLNGASRNGQLR
jgi:hypothetical protein